MFPLDSTLKKIFVPHSNFSQLTGFYDILMFTSKYNQIFESYFVFLNLQRMMMKIKM